MFNLKGNDQLTETLIALMGIWLIFSPLPDFFATIFSLSAFSNYQSHETLFATQVVHVATKVVCGILLLLARKKIVSLFGLQTNITTNTRSLLSAAIFILGLYFMLNGSVSFGQYWATEQQNTSNLYLFWEGLFSFVSGALVLVSSFFLGKIWALFNHA